ncbi:MULTISPECIES: 3-hydroxyacyl-CoA dehydrogenase NAD-binding domain-containing protein [unclassified Pseudoalteromonas]|uniref:3-hydroxyacyl-CoA dehydrogenase family protein n=1 Tax=unclassified Pseudoalteromonas TaxID=194690 RepID=UPI000C08B333|nr:MULTISPECIES: 3-hydroxyacyl-CoA dehydrogenase NAD-binding domain-containing protein [unclassified Pseudoalteromonas]MDP2636858.1 3-hydroxyacyl-CoA dehydrogenase NAD-binding domain-containing protein [Pseudoalteromonas sp. 1_MG-2023]PHN88692.1 3-hydroxybutyryl-CoA dehydrogenase [Pseudoalteromonas sp. 3D05]
MFSKILVIGAGTMGAGVASQFALKGFSVTVLVRNEDKAIRLRSDLEKLIKRSLKRMQSEETQSDILAKINIVKELENDVGYDFVFEAISENISQKKQIIHDYTDFITENTIWATNTSSLSVTDMAAGYKYPENFIGIHFFNPVASMELVEIIPSMLTSPSVVEKCWEFCTLLQKKPVRVEDSPGFIVNRLLIPMINEAVEILSSQVASAEEIDSAMKLGAHHPLGPLALADLIGNDVCLSIMEALYTATSDSKYRPSYLLRKMVSAKKLGRKTGIGFYSY